MTVRIVHKNSSASGKNPTASQLANGELSINYHSDGPFLSVKDTNGRVVRVGGVWINDSSPTDPKHGALWLRPVDNKLSIYDADAGVWRSVSGTGGGGGGGGDITGVTAGAGLSGGGNGPGNLQLDVELSAQSGLEFVGAGDARTLQVDAGTGLRIAGDGSLEATGGGLTYIGVVSPDDDADLQDADVGEIYACDVTTVNGTNPVTPSWYNCITNLASPADVSVGDLLICTRAGGGTPANSQYTRLATGGANQITTINANEGLTATVAGGNTVNLAVDLHQTSGTPDSGLEFDPAGNNGELRVNVGTGIEINASNELQIDADDVPVPGTGDFGFWNRTEPGSGDVLQPKTAGDDVYTSGDLKAGGTVASPTITLAGADGSITSSSIDSGDDKTTGTGILMSTDAGLVVRSQPKGGIEIDSGQIQLDPDFVPGGGNGDGQLGYWTRDNANTNLSPATDGDDIFLTANSTAATDERIIFRGNDSRDVSISGPNAGLTRSYRIILPDDEPAANEFLQVESIDGSQNAQLQWAAAAAGATVTIGDNPPASPGQGDLWWNSDDGRLYVWYEEAGAGGSKQWVDASPDSFQQFWKLTGNVLSPVNDAHGVTIGGATTNIVLNADGSAGYDQGISLSSSTPAAIGDGSNFGTRIGMSQGGASLPGYLISFRDVGGGDDVLNVGGNAGSMRVRGDGAVRIGGTSASPKILLNANGAGTFEGEVSVDNLDTGSGARIYPSGAIYARNDTGGTALFQGYQGGNLAANIKFQVLANGNASFAGTITTQGGAGGPYVAIGETITFNTEADNPANYTSATSISIDPETGEETTVETQVYNGPTLDVKEVLLDLQQRVADRDAVIADLVSRITALEGGN